jgi:hypothetical protein
MSPDVLCATTWSPDGNKYQVLGTRSMKAGKYEVMPADG